jgi:hypothetical protein
VEKTPVWLETKSAVYGYKSGMNGEKSGMNGEKSGVWEKIR